VYILWASTFVYACSLESIYLNLVPRLSISKTDIYDGVLFLHLLMPWRAIAFITEGLGDRSVSAGQIFISTRLAEVVVL